MQLANLEVLLGSTDILPTFTTMAFVRWSRISLAMGAALLIYWGFGLASDQAILRALSVGSGAKYTNASLYYFDTSVDSAPSIFSQPNQVEMFGETVNIVFQAGVLSAPAFMNNPSDVWGNVKIPVLQDLDALTVDDDVGYYLYTNNASLEDNNGWLPVPSSNVSYTSLIGNPIYGLSPQSNSSFGVTTSSFYATCGDPILYPSETAEFTWPAQHASTCIKNSPPILLGGNRKINGTILGTCSIGSLSENQWDGSATSGSQLRPILFQSQSKQGVSAFNCSIEYVTTATIVECNALTCSAAYIQAANSSTPSWISPLDNCTTAQNFYNQFAVACQSGPRSGSSAPVSSILEVFLMTGSYTRGKNLPAVDLSQLSGAVLSDRFTKVLNSFWMASIHPEFVPGTISTFVPDPISLDNVTRNYLGQPSTSGVIQFNTKVWEAAPVFVRSQGWVYLLCWSGGVLILLGLFILMWECNLREPNLFANTTSIMRAPLLEYDEGSIPSTIADVKTNKLVVKLKDMELGQKSGRLVLVDQETDDRPLVEMSEATNSLA